MMVNPINSSKCSFYLPHPFIINYLNYLLMRKAMLLAVGMLLAVVFCFAQTKTVTGTVTNVKNGQPVVGATVSSKMSNVAVISGTDGGFTITVKDGEKELVVSYVGFTDATVPITGNTVSVKLNE